MTDSSKRPIGVFDSGVGGLTVFRALERQLPDESLVYLGDTARVPYGPKSARTITRYSREAAVFLRGHDVKLIVVACNSASSVGLSAMHEQGTPVVGVIEPGARRAVERSRTGKIGIIGTRTTIGSGAYQRAVAALRPEAEVICAPCPLFVPLAEEGWTDNDVARATAERYLAPFREAGVDTLVLGCTHYPLLHDVIQQTMGDDVTLIDSAGVVAREVRDRLGRESSLAAPVGQSAEHHFFVTDAPEPFQQVAERFPRPADHAAGTGEYRADAHRG